MKKVFLVDDEKVIRQGISKSIDWAKEGFEYCGDAPDGEVALPLIEKYKPDIVITDIKMPFMDGLQLSRMLRNKMPWIKIIILSGHDEFEYAREAMRIQITEYCLKPLSSSDLLEILHKVSAQIDWEEQEKNQLNDLKSQALKSLSLSRDQFLKELCEGTYNTADAIRKATELSIDLIANYYYILIVESETTESTGNWIIKQYPCLLFKRKEKETVFIMKGESKRQLEQQAEAIRKQLLSQHDSLTFGFGKVETRIQGIAVSFKGAEEEKSYSSIVHKYYVKDSETDTQAKKEIHQFNRKDLIDFLKFGDSTKIAEFSRSYSSYLASTVVRTPFVTYYFLMDFTITITHYIKDQQDNEPVDILQEIHQLEMKASWIREYSEVLTYMEEMLRLVIESREQFNSKFGSIIQKTKDYINDQYNDPQLSLQTVAKRVNISPSYLSHMFSQETGQTLIEYLTKTRIERAKELLKTTNDKTYEIANKVGYSDSHYFCHTFKKVTGMTTREFKSHGQLLTF